MRRLLILTVALLAVAASPAHAATKTVQITKTGFTPASVTINAGDTIVWRNADSTNHQVVADNGTFASPILRPNRSFSFRFDASGTYRYRDTYNRTFRGTVFVKGAPPSVAIAASAPIVIYGNQIHITGQVSNRRAGETVTLLSKPYPQASFAQLTEVVTGTDGTFDFVTEPELLTQYQASWKGASSLAVTVEVKPRLIFRYNFRTKVFSVAVTAGRSFAGRAVYLQRLSGFGQWVNLKKVVLNAEGKRLFRAKLPVGRNRVRAFLTVNQAGAGYLAHESGVWNITIKKKKTRR